MSQYARHSNQSKNYDYLDFCNNIIEGYTYLLRFHDGFVPLEVEAGSTPQITLRARGHNNVVAVVLEKNQPLAREISVDISNGHVQVYVLGELVLDILAETPEKALIKKINLNSFGIKLTGDENGLVFGEMSLKNSFFRNVSTILAVGE